MVDDNTKVKRMREIKRFKNVREKKKWEVPLGNRILSLSLSLSSDYLNVKIFADSHVTVNSNSNNGNNSNKNSNNINHDNVCIIITVATKQYLLYSLPLSLSHAHHPPIEKIKRFFLVSLQKQWTYSFICLLSIKPV